MIGQHPDTGRISFNPHTHEGCDSIPVTSLVLVEVSIHTPTKGVTGDVLKIVTLAVVSIHTPTKGVTLLSELFSELLSVSIHTPTKGVT